MDQARKPQQDQISPRQADDVEKDQPAAIDTSAWLATAPAKADGGDADTDTSEPPPDLVHAVGPTIAGMIYQRLSPEALQALAQQLIKQVLDKASAGASPAEQDLAQQFSASAEALGDQYLQGAEGQALLQEISKSLTRPGPAIALAIIGTAYKLLKTDPALVGSKTFNVGKDATIDASIDMGTLHHIALHALHVGGECLVGSGKLQVGVDYSPQDGSALTGEYKKGPLTIDGRLGTDESYLRARDDLKVGGGDLALEGQVGNKVSYVQGDYTKGPLTIDGRLGTDESHLGLKDSFKLGGGNLDLGAQISTDQQKDQISAEYAHPIGHGGEFDVGGDYNPATGGWEAKAGVKFRF